MKQPLTDKKKIVKAVLKMVADREVVRSYLKGEITIREINKKGIKLAKPI